MSNRVTLLVTVFAIVGPTGLPAQTVTAFKTGEQITGLTKQCYYAFGTTRYTKTIRSVELCPLSVQVRTAPVPQQEQQQPLRDTSQASRVTAFKTGEETTGLTKQCYYAFGSTRYTKTIQSVELCPLSIKVRL
jgi:hypothetical protein